VSLSLPSALRRGLALGIVVAGVSIAPTSVAMAEPAPPATASQAEQQLAQLSGSASALNEQVLAAREDLTTKQAAERIAQERVATARAAQAQAQADQVQYQGTVDRLASASYQGARLNKLSALMLAASPQELLDQMSGLDVLAADTNSRVGAYVAATTQATTAQREAQSAAAAATDAAHAALQIQDELTAKQGELGAQAGRVRAQFASLTASQQRNYAGSTTPPGYTAPPPPAVTPAPAVTPPAVTPPAVTPPAVTPPAVTPPAGTSPSAVTPPAVTPPAVTSPSAMASAGTSPSAMASAGTSPAATASAGRSPAATARAGAVTSGSGVGYAALQAALSKLGSPYEYGAAGPGSFDCSGLVQWAYKQAGVSVPRTSQAQAGVGTPVAQQDLQPGDIVAFYGGGHVGIYAGNGNVVHAPDYGQPVKVAPMRYMDFTIARRV